MDVWISASDDGHKPEWVDPEVEVKLLESEGEVSGASPVRRGSGALSESGHHMVVWGAG